MTPTNNYTQERDRLIEKLQKEFKGRISGGLTFVDLADFILSDRKRIVAPLKDIDEADLTKAEKQILKNAGVEL